MVATTMDEMEVILVVAAAVSWASGRGDTVVRVAAWLTGTGFAKALVM